MTGTHVLTVEALRVRFQTPDGEVQAVDDVSFHLDPGETLGVVGESGSGKTQIFLAIMGLLAKNGRAFGSVRCKDREILNAPARDLNRIRGVSMAMIFQDPMTSLNPFLKISKQMTEVLVEHRGMSETKALQCAVAMLDRVGIPDAAQRAHMYPHEFSGGMRQRAMIAMALLCDPEILIADEPTTALDVTVQAQILDLLRDLQKDLDTAIVMITHDLGVVAGLCDRVMVMYGGRVVETGGARDIFHDGRHPYTEGLLKSMPRIDKIDGESLFAIPGQPPNLQNLPRGCAYSERCAHATVRCRAARPRLTGFGDGRASACFREYEA